VPGSPRARGGWPRRGAGVRSSSVRKAGQRAGQLAVNLDLRIQRGSCAQLSVR